MVPEVANVLCDMSILSYDCLSLVSGQGSEQTCTDDDKVDHEAMQVSYQDLGWSHLPNVAVHGHTGRMNVMIARYLLSGAILPIYTVEALRVLGKHRR